ncbi:MAG: DUF3267 domain-containing protein [Clostridia bacterium]|nr:DUF3267 domain-containing protein [Clostridia bacterium]
MKHFETDLPAGYREAFTIDAASKKTGVTLNLAAAVIMAAVLIPAILIIRPGNILEGFSFSRYLITIGTLLVYLVLHELVHGAAYKLLTRQKLTFGFTATVAYCGVPDIYVYRRASMIALLAPFCVFTVVFGLAVALLQDPWDKTFAAAVLAIHLGGCVGDLYDTSLYLFRFRDPRTLMRDTGPRQTFYVKG